MDLILRKNWHIDYDATSHMTFDLSVFSTYRSVTSLVLTMGDKHTSIAIGRVDVHLQVRV